MPQRPQPSLRLADGGNFVTNWARKVMRPKNTEQRLREIEAPPPAPVARPAPPPPPPNATPDNPAGIRFQDGGVVPGTGTGDKIPAKYEPGEFVVSNDMIDDNPGLREQLSGLRAETLAARGKTVEEADAKALRYHGGLRGGEYGQESTQRGGSFPGGTARRQGTPVHIGAEVGGGMGGDRAGLRLPGSADLPRGGRPQVSLRAAEGFPGVDVFERPMTADEAARFRPGEAAAHANNVNPKLTPNNPAFHGEGRYGAPPNPTTAAPAAPAAPAQGGVRGAMRGAKEFALGAGETTKSVGGTFKSVGGGLKAAGATGLGLAKTALTSPIAAGAAGGMAAYDGFNTDTEAYAKRFGMESTEPGVGRDLGLRTLGVASDLGNNLLLGLPGKYLFRDKQDQGAEGTPNGAPTASTQNTLSNPYANVTPEQGRAMAEVNAGAPGRAPGSQPTPQEDSPDVGRVTRNGNEYSGTNVGGGGNITINGFAPGAGLNLGSGPNARNMAAGDALAGRSQAESMARVQGGMGGGGGSAPQMPQAPTVRHSGNDWQARNDLRNAMVSATSITNDGGKWDKHKGVSPERAYAAGLAETDAKLRGAQPGVDVATLQSNNSLRGSLASADASRYGSDNSLRGAVYSADSSRAGQMATARSKQQELAYNRQRDALKDSMDIEKHNQTIGHNATNNARDRLKGMAVRDDGKGGTVVDEGRLARLESTLTKMSPGWAQSGEATQAGLLRKAEASVNILEGLNNQRNNGWLQAFGIDGKSAQLDNLPHKEMKGAKLNEVGFADGVTTPGTSRKDYVIETSGGHKLYLPRSSVNQGELELLKSLGVDVTGSKK